MDRSRPSLRRPACGVLAGALVLLGAAPASAHVTLTPSTTTGDGITLGESVGGRLDRSVASPVAYCPVSVVKYRNG